MLGQYKISFSALVIRSSTETFKCKRSFISESVEHVEGRPSNLKYTIAPKGDSPMRLDI